MSPDAFLSKLAGIVIAAASVWAVERLSEKRSRRERLLEAIEQTVRQMAATTAVIGTGRGLSVATKVLHLKRPRLFPVLDSLVLNNLGVTDSVAPIQIVDHLRHEGRRNLDALSAIQVALRPDYERTLVRVLDALLWASHPAAGLGPSMGGWEHVFRPRRT